MFLKLHGKLRELDVDQAYLAKKLHIDASTLSLRFNGKGDWRMSEMYAIMDLIQEPYEKLHEYFPKGGGIAAGKKKAS